MKTFNPPTERRAADNHDRRVALRYRPGYTGDLIPAFLAGAAIGFLVALAATWYLARMDLATACSTGEAIQLPDGRVAECWVPHYGPTGDPQ